MAYMGLAAATAGEIRMRRLEGSSGNLKKTLSSKLGVQGFSGFRFLEDGGKSEL